MVKTSLMLQRMLTVDMRICMSLNRVIRWSYVRRFFAGVSRLGDGVVWYSLMLVLPFIHGLTAISVSLRMAGAGALGLLLYKLIKKLTTRLRPFMVSDAIALGTHPLDHYSFPSGHTLHAFSFSLVCMYYYPEYAMVLVPLTILIALSRVVLGLHYPTDVLAGAALGTSIATGFILL